MGCKGNTISSGIGLTDATDSGTFPLRAFDALNHYKELRSPKMDRFRIASRFSMQEFVFPECTP
jgi:hypothetical protein